LEESQNLGFGLNMLYIILFQPPINNNNKAGNKYIIYIIFKKISR
jgi:hypothetical protein